MSYFVVYDQPSWTEAFRNCPIFFRLEGGNLQMSEDKTEIWQPEKPCLEFRDRTDNGLWTDCESEAEKFSLKLFVSGPFPGMRVSHLRLSCSDFPIVWRTHKLLGCFIFSTIAKVWWPITANSKIRILMDELFYFLFYCFFFFYLQIFFFHNSYLYFFLVKVKVKWVEI